MRFKSEGGGAMDSKNFLRLKDKESAKGLFVGDPYEFKVHWNGKASDLCTQDNRCAHCSLGDKPKFRFRMNFIIHENGTYIAKVFEQGWNTYLSLKELHEGEYNLENHLVVISRSGSGANDTRYSILPAKNGDLKPDQLRAVMSAPLQDLTHKEEPRYNNNVGSGKIDPDYAPEPAFDDDEKLPF